MVVTLTFGTKVINTVLKYSNSNIKRMTPHKCGHLTAKICILPDLICNIISACNCWVSPKVSIILSVVAVEVKSQGSIILFY